MAAYATYSNSFREERECGDDGKGDEGREQVAGTSETA
jgi:hypothetical protein